LRGAILNLTKEQRKQLDLSLLAFCRKNLQQLEDFLDRFDMVISPKPDGQKITHIITPEVLKAIREQVYGIFDDEDEVSTTPVLEVDGDDDDGAYISENPAYQPARRQ
jgi:hypothetical protein